MGGRQEVATGPLGRVLTQGAAFGWLRESDDVAAATAAAASAVKFMLIESEAAATSASFLPAQFSPSPFPPIKSAKRPNGAHAQLCSGQGKTKRKSVAEMEPKGEGGHTQIL